MRSKSSQTRNNLRHSSWDALFATPWTLLSLPASFLVAGMLNSLFEVGPFWFGIISAMPAWANALQILLIPFLAGFMRVRALALSQSWLNFGLWVAGLAGIVFLSTDDPKTAGLFFAILFCLVSTSFSLLYLGWMAWVGDFVPLRIRGRYMGRRNCIANLSTITFMVLSLALLHFMDASRTAYVILVSLALATRAVSIMVQHHIVSPDPTGGPIAKSNWIKDVANLRQNKPLMRFIVFGTVVGFGMGFHTAVTPLYAFGKLGATPAAFTGYFIAATITGALFVPIWGELIDRHGARPALIISLIAWRIGDFGWAFITPQSLNWMYPMWAWGGIMGTGYMLAAFNFLLKLIPQEDRAAGISLNLTVTSISAAIAPVLAGILLTKAEGLSWDIFLTYRTVIVAGLLGMISSALILLRIKEPETHPERNSIVGAMRTLRQLTVNQGLAFLSNATLIVTTRNSPFRP